MLFRRCVQSMVREDISTLGMYNPNERATGGAYSGKNTFELLPEFGQ